MGLSLEIGTNGIENGCDAMTKKVDCNAKRSDREMSKSK